MRRAVLADANEIAACLAALQYGTSTAHVARRLAEAPAREDAAVFVGGAPLGGALVGVESAHAIPLFHTPGQLARFTAVAVREGAERHGYGRALLTAAEAWAWGVRAVRIEITSGATANPPMPSTVLSATQKTNADSSNTYRMSSPRGLIARRAHTGCC